MLKLNDKYQMKQFLAPIKKYKDHKKIFKNMKYILQIVLF
jgi:hypothetical protein